MKTPDANLLIHAYDENSEHHERAKQWLEKKSFLARTIRIEPADCHGFFKNFNQPADIYRAVYLARSNRDRQ